MPQKVLVGCPTADIYRKYLDEYLERAKNLDYPNYDVVLVDNSKTDDYFNEIKSKGIRAVKVKYHDNPRERLITSRNVLRDITLKENYDYLLSLEQDVIPPKDVIKRLIKHNRDITSGVYYNYKILEKVDGNKVRVKVPVLFIESRENPGKLRWLLPEIVEKPRLLKVYICGMGCVLISRKVLEKVKFRYNKEEKSFDDVYFGIDAKNNNFPVFVDTSVKCKHLSLYRDWSWSNLPNE